MTAVSQRIPLYTGGVSQQADEKMGLGQVKEALNCYPDVTLGMIKRPGGRFTGLLNGLTPNSADTQKWFSIFRDNDEKYISTIAPDGTPRVWNLVTGNEATVNYPAGKEAAVKAYLNASDPRNLKTLTINDFTYIVNSEKVVTAKPADPTFTPNLQATIVVNLVEYDTTYSVTIGGFTYLTLNQDLFLYKLILVIPSTPLSWLMLPMVSVLLSLLDSQQRRLLTIPST
jgi:hypothetical protein